MIKSEDENGFVYDLLSNHRGNRSGWIGLYRKADNKFYWLDDRPRREIIRSGKLANQMTVDAWRSVALMENGMICLARRRPAPLLSSSGQFRQGNMQTCLYMWTILVGNGMEVKVRTFPSLLLFLLPPAR